MKRSISIVFSACLAMAFLAGCAIWRVDTTFIKTASDYVPEKHKKASQVEVFIKDTPASPYKEIGTLRAVGVENTDNEVLIKAMRISAAKIGADAIMGVQSGMQTVGGVRPGGIVCDEFSKCSYLEHNSTISSVPSASATAIIFIQNTNPGN